MARLRASTASVLARVPHRPRSPARGQCDRPRLLQKQQGGASDPDPTPQGTQVYCGIGELCRLIVAQAISVAFEMSMPMLSFTLIACLALFVEGRIPLCIRSGLRRRRWLFTQGPPSRTPLRID